MHETFVHGCLDDEMFLRFFFVFYCCVFVCYIMRYLKVLPASRSFSLLGFFLPIDNITPFYHRLLILKLKDLYVYQVAKIRNSVPHELKKLSFNQLKLKYKNIFVKS